MSIGLLTTLVANAGSLLGSEIRFGVAGASAPVQGLEGLKGSKRVFGAFGVLDPGIFIWFFRSLGPLGIGPLGPGEDKMGGLEGLLRGHAGPRVQGIPTVILLAEHFKTLGPGRCATIYFMAARLERLEGFQLIFRLGILGYLHRACIAAWLALLRPAARWRCALCSLEQGCGWWASCAWHDWSRRKQALSLKPLQEKLTCLDCLLGVPASVAPFCGSLRLAPS